MTNPITRGLRHFEDLAIGESHALGPRRVDKDDILAFAREFDPFPFHLDEAAAKKSLLGGLAASGWHTGALSLRMLVDAFLGDVASMGGLGFKNLKWTRPLMKGDTLSGTATVRALRRSRNSPSMGIVETELAMVNQKGQTVMTMDLSHAVELRNPTLSLDAEALP